MLFKQEKINAFGLDISDSSIKVLQLSQEQRKLQIKAFGDMALMPKVIENNLIINEQRLAENILRAVGAAGKISTKHVICSIPEVKSFVRIIKVPKMPEKRNSLVYSDEECNATRVSAHHV